MTEKKMVPTKMRVLRSVRKSGEEACTEDEQIIEINVFETVPAMAIAEIPIRMSKDYNSIGITIGVHLPCYAEEIEAAIERAYELAINRVSKEIPLIKEALEKTSESNPPAKKTRRKS